MYQNGLSAFSQNLFLPVTHIRLDIIQFFGATS